MQIYLSTYRLFIFLLFLSVVVACGTDGDTSDSAVQPETIQYGKVSGIITDAGTNNPIPNVVVMLNDLEVKTEADGVYTFLDVPYDVEHQLTVQDPDYQDFKHDFTLNQVRLTINVPLIPISDVDKPPEPTQYGTVSGIITDAEANNPIPNVVVMLNDLEIKTEADGVYTFLDVPYDVEHQLTVQDPDYQDFKHDFTLNQVRLTINVPLIPKIDNEEELKAFFEDFSALIESVDPENIESLQAKFSETYVAGDDPATLFAIASGVIPQNYESVLPTVTALFETYSWIQFDFKQLEIDITHARKASIHTLLDIESENAGDGDLSHIEARCEFEFRREETDWKIVHWEVLFLDVQM